MQWVNELIGCFDNFRVNVCCHRHVAFTFSSSMHPKPTKDLSPVCPLGRYGIAAPRFQRPGPWSKRQGLAGHIQIFFAKRSMNEINWNQLALKTSLPFPLNQLNREFQKEGLMPSSMQKSNTGRSASHFRSQWCDLHRTHEWDSEFHLWNRYCVSKWPRVGDRIAHYSSNFSHKVVSRRKIKLPKTHWLHDPW